MHKNFFARFSKPFKGFTLVELLLVVLILGILVSLSLVIMNPDRLKARIRDSQRKKDLEVISLALEQYYADHNAYPNTNMAGLITVLAGSATEPTYIKNPPTDPKPTYGYCYAAHQLNQQNYVLCSVLETDTIDHDSVDELMRNCDATPNPRAAGPVGDSLGQYCITNPL
jgi:prepilin-type N-terminal cleavage/methylation domain-containing protein